MKNFPSDKRLKEMETKLVNGGSLEVIEQCILVMELSRIRRQERLEKQRKNRQTKRLIKLAKKHNCRFIVEKKKS